MSAEIRGDVLKRLIVELRAGLHDLCQPLSTMQCLLELGTTETADVELHGCIGSALIQCHQINVRVTALRESVLRAMAAGD